MPEGTRFRGGVRLHEPERGCFLTFCALGASLASPASGPASGPGPALMVERNAWRPNSGALVDKASPFCLLIVPYQKREE